MFDQVRLAKVRTYPALLNEVRPIIGQCNRRRVVLKKRLRGLAINKVTASAGEMVETFCNLIDLAPVFAFCAGLVCADCKIKVVFDDLFFYVLSPAKKL